LSFVNQVKPSNSEETRHSTLMARIVRFFSVAAFYPPGHTKCQAAITELHQAIDHVVQVKAPLVLEPSEGGIRLQGVEMDQDTPGIGPLFNLLDCLGVARLEIDRSAPIEDLHKLVNNLNTRKLEATSALEFHTMEFSNLPPSVKIVQREFGWGRFELGGNESISVLVTDKLNDLSDRIEQQGWPETRKKELQLRMEAFLTKVVERLDSPDSIGQAQSTQSRRSLEDVLVLGTTAISQTIGSLSGDKSSVDIDRLFQQAAESLAYADDSSSVSIMLEVLNEGSGPELTGGNQEPTENLKSDETDYRESAEDLTAKTLQNAAQAEKLEITNSDNSSEMLSVCLQLLVSGVPDTLTTKLRSRLRKNLMAPLGKPKQSIIEKTISNLVLAGNRKPVDAALPLLLPALVENSNDQFIDFMQQLLPEYQPEKTALVWPHFVGLMLQPKPPRNPETQKHLMDTICNLHPDLMKPEAHRLDFLKVVQAGKWGSALFMLPWMQNHHLLQSLLAGRQGRITGQKLHEIWKKKHPSTLGGVLMKILGPYHSNHREFYTQLLKNQKTESHPVEFKKQVALKISKSLEALDSSGKEAAWVPHAISELGHLGCRESLGLLTEIEKKKRMLLLPLWPAPCRESARQAILILSAPAAEGGRNHD